MNVVEKFLPRTLNFLFSKKLQITKEKEMIDENIYTYVVVRTNLPKIHQAVQAGHAVQEAAKRFGKTDKVNYLIYLQVSNKKELFEAMEYLGMNGIETVPFYEPDENRRLTAFASNYLTTRKQRDYFKRFEMLWQGEQI